MKLHSLRQGSPEWLRWRSEGIGGSAAGSIILGDEWPYEDSRRAPLLDQMIRRKGGEVNYAMRRGTRMEPDARKAYEAWAGEKAPAVCVEHDDESWMRVSLDGLVVASRRILELKAPDWKAHNYALAGYVPPWYMPQCQWQLLVCGLTLLDYASYSTHSMFVERDQLAIVPVTPDPEMQARLLEAVRGFWEEVCRGRERLEAEETQAREQNRQAAVATAHASWARGDEVPY